MLFGWRARIAADESESFEVGKKRSEVTSQVRVWINFVGADSIEETRLL